YLAPGVFIEEIPARLKAIEGVSTSTASLVGVAERGPVAGFPIPFDGEAQNFAAPRDPAPVLVTSFAEFTRTFAAPLPLPDAGHRNSLARAVAGFFGNGGRRCFIARVVDMDPLTFTSTATRSTIPLQQGVVHRLVAPGRNGAATVTLNTLRNV